MTDADAQPTHREAMSRVDTAWLRMERPTNLMMITGVMMFDTPMSIERLRKTIRQRFLAYPRFTQKAVDNGAAAFWETDTHFDLEHHVRLTALPGKGGKRELERFTSQMASSPLDQTKPLWQFHLVEKYGGGSALITRIHHCYADGIALVQVLLSLTDTSAEATKSSHLDKAWLKQDGDKIKRRFGGVDRAVKTAEKLLGKGMDFYRDPSLAAVLAKEGTDIARELALALSLSDDPQTVFKGRLGITKRVAWAEPLQLEEVKAVGRAFDCTVNDVLLASAAGALRSYMLERGEDLDGVSLRATVPVNLRPLEHAQKLGNHFGLVFLDLPVGEPNPARRLELVAAHMRLLKTSRQAAATFGALAAVGMAPSGIQSIALELFSRKASLVATNVPGPQQPLYLAGSKIHEMMFWVPQNGSIGVGISIMSYNGKVHFGLIGDAKLIPDPDAIIQRFRPEFEKLLYVALMARWEDTIYAEDAEAMMIDAR